MAQRILALDIGERQIRAALVESSFRDYKVIGLYEDEEDGETPLPDRLRAFLARHDMRPDTILATIPSELATQRTLNLPFRDRKRLDQTVPFELETLVPFGLDDVVVDYQVLQRDRASSTVLAALVQKSDLQKHLATLAEAGIDPKVVDFGPLCGLNLLNTVAKDLPETFAYLEVSKSDATVAFYRERRLLGVRSLVTLRAAENGSSSPPTPSPERLANDLRWTLLVLNEGPLDPGLPCLLAGEPGELLTQLAQELSEKLGLEVTRLESLRLRPVPGVSNGQAPAFARPLGLALRELSPANSVGLNFRRGEFTYHRGQVEMRRTLARIGALAAVFVVLMMTNLFVSYRLEQARVAAIDGQIRNVFAATVPDTPISSNPATQLQSQIETAQKKLALLADAAPVGNLTAIDLLRTVAAAIPAKVTIDTDEYVMDTDSVRIRGKTASFESIDAIKKQLAAVTYFREVQVKDSRASRDGTGVDFRLILLLNKPGQEPAS